MWPPILAMGLRPNNEEWKKGQAKNADNAAAAAADQSKMAAVDKVVSMLEDLQLQVLAEGEAEAASYNKVVVFYSKLPRLSEGSRPPPPLPFLHVEFNFIRLRARGGRLRKGP